MENSWPNPCPNRDTQSCAPMPGVLKNPQEGNPIASLVPVPVLHNPHSQNAFLDVLFDLFFERTKSMFKMHKITFQVGLFSCRVIRSFWNLCTTVLITAPPSVPHLTFYAKSSSVTLLLSFPSHSWCSTSIKWCLCPGPCRPLTSAHSSAHCRGGSKLMVRILLPVQCRDIFFLLIHLLL